MTGKIFNEEKILYFAETEGLFHIQPNEPKDSDCRRIVRHLIGRGWLETSSEDDSGRFFRITHEGRKRLVDLQIQWRRANGKSTDQHEEKLRQLQAADHATE